MESRNYTQKLVLGSERYGSCRRRKKNSDKPKHPQRGPGVAQLEKIILQNQMIATCLSQFDCDLHKHIARVQMRYASSPSSTTTASSSSSSSLFELHQSIMVCFGDTAEMDIKQSAFSSGATARCNWCSSSHQAVQPTAALPPLEQSMQKMNRLHEDQALQELDLELRL
ncbi:unnamed protein product [Musa acuminata subsp. burmannicoides]